MATLQNYVNHPYFPPTPPHNFPCPLIVPPPSPPKVAPPPPHIVPSPPHPISPPPPHPISPPPPPPHIVPPPPHPISPPPPPHVVPSPPPPHPVSPPPPPPHIVPPPPHPVFPPPPPHIVPSPPHPFSPPPPPPPTPGHHTVIIFIFVSLGGLFFLAFLSVALFCFLKKRKRRIIQETDKVKIDEHVRVHEDIVPGPHGTKTVILTIDEDVDIEEEIKKTEVVGKRSYMKSAENHPRALDMIATTSDHTHNHQ